MICVLLAATFLFVKTGEKFATQEIAAPTVEGLTGYVAEKLGGPAALLPQVFNDPVRAAEFSAKQKPLAGIVTPGFYLAYGRLLGLEPLLETKRVNVEAERYVVVARKGAGEDLSGKVIATTLAAEERYVLAVVLQNKFGRDVRLRPAPDAESALFELAEGGPDAALVEEAAWALYREDPELGQKLEVVYRSEQLPRDLVVVFAGSKLDPARLKSVLKEMTGSEDGQRILRSIRVEAFVDLDEERLCRAKALFHAD
jgi:hypothetical protein